MYPFRPSGARSEQMDVNIGRHPIRVRNSERRVWLDALNRFNSSAVPDDHPRLGRVQLRGGKLERKLVHHQTRRE